MGNGMVILLKNGVLADPRTEFFNQLVNLVIRNGKIETVSADAIDIEADLTLDLKKAYVFPAFTDIFSWFGEPGFEFKETLETGAAAAAAGGYCRVLTLPNTLPAVHNKSQISYIIGRSAHLKAQILPYGCITKNAEGKELAEMYDMWQSGAIAFTDGLHPIQNSQVLAKALQYVKAVDALIVQVPDETSLNKYGVMHEGIISTQLGLAGQPAIAETLMINRDLELAHYTDSRLHITGVSTAAGIQLIKAAKQKGVRVTCSVTPNHLLFTDENLVGYNTNFKLTPPLRSPADRQALCEAVLDGTVDCIASHHQPHEWDAKVCEFAQAKSGSSGLETTVSAVCKALPQLTPSRMAELFSINPASIFKLDLPLVKEGQLAKLSLVDFQESWVCLPEMLKSAGKNNTMLNQSFMVKPLGIINESSVFLNH